MKTTIRLADDLLRRARKKAAEEGRSLTSLVEEGLKTVLAESKVARLAKTTQNPAGDLKVVNNERSRRVKNLSPLSLDQKSHENDSKAGGMIPLRRMTASFEKPRLSGAAAALG
jgi:hypothetical protein